LLDINVLVALVDPEHSYHDRAHEVWSDVTQHGGWASCPLTQNGMLRVLTNENYPGFSDYSKTDVFNSLGNLVRNSDHKFWPDEISILDRSRFDADAIFGPKQLTDIYLLGLAMYNEGRFVTFDRRIPVSALIDKTDEHLWTA
jgi:toxin-antitoxin system PIN domain toxin